MSECVLSISGLNKSFGKKAAVRSLDLQLFGGEVFGFIGPNGAGKTTTIKMITGLLLPDSGSISICGNDIAKNFEAAMSGLGSIVETPEMYGYLTGLQNLRQVARMRGSVSEARINEVIEIVGLKNRIHDKVKKYSLGMKQRLGVALALLNHPRLLVLDEPTNGLDPAGIKELRDILRAYAKTDGCCVMVSSHLMSEIEHMCDRAGFIVDGELKAINTIENLVSVRSESNVFRYTVSDADRVNALLINTRLPFTRIDASAFDITLKDDERRALNSLLFSNNIDISSMIPSHRRLEDVFIQLTQTGGGVQIG